MKFKINYHLARNISPTKVKSLIENYPKQFPKPKYLLFIDEMLKNGWRVKLHQVKVSKYLFVTKDDEIYKIRFSNHKPLYEREIENDCDYYVGISHKQISTTDDLIKRFIK